MPICESQTDPNWLGRVAGSGATSPSSARRPSASPGLAGWSERGHGRVRDHRDGVAGGPRLRRHSATLGRRHLSTTSAGSVSSIGSSSRLARPAAGAGRARQLLAGQGHELPASALRATCRGWRAAARGPAAGRRHRRRLPRPSRSAARGRSAASAAPSPRPSVCLSGTSVIERSSSSPATRRPDRDESRSTRATGVMS